MPNVNPRSASRQQVQEPAVVPEELPFFLRVLAEAAEVEGVPVVPEELPFFLPVLAEAVVLSSTAAPGLKHAC